MLSGNVRVVPRKTFWDVEQEHACQDRPRCSSLPPDLAASASMTTYFLDPPLRSVSSASVSTSCGHDSRLPVSAAWADVADSDFDEDCECHSSSTCVSKCFDSASTADTASVSSSSTSVSKCFDICVADTACALAADMPDFGLPASIGPTAVMESPATQDAAATAADVSGAATEYLDKFQFHMWHLQPLFCTTLIFRNLSLSTDSFMTRLNKEGFTGRYDFVYQPCSFKSGKLLNFFIVNMVSPQDAWTCFHQFNLCWNMDFFDEYEDAESFVQFAEHNEARGLFALTQKYRNSPVMHEDVPAEWKPKLFCNGQEVQFPKPEKLLKRPRGCAKIRRTGHTTTRQNISMHGLFS